MISKASDDNPTKWDKRLPLLLFVYRSVQIMNKTKIPFGRLQTHFTDLILQTQASPTYLQEWTAELCDSASTFAFNCPACMYVSMLTIPPLANSDHLEISIDLSIKPIKIAKTLGRLIWRYAFADWTKACELITVLYLILRFNFEKTRVFLVKVVNRSIYIYIMRIRKNLIFYVRLDWIIRCIRLTTVVGIRFCLKTLKLFGNYGTINCDRL